MTTSAKTNPQANDVPAAIRFYMKGPEPFRFLSNFFPSPFTLDGLRYETNEHYFQSQKALDPEEAEWVRTAPTALEAKRRGRRVALRPDWPTVKLEVMARGLEAKFTQNPELRARLIATGDAVLGEHPRAFRGKGADTGKAVGPILMDLRARLRGA